jgi:uncharacterized oxidoreductase
MVKLSAAALQNFVSEIFQAAGCSAVEGERVARHLVAANLAGHDSHGVIRVPRYVQMAKDGAIYPDRTVSIVVDTPVIAVVDGQYGFGQTVATQAVKIGIDKCLATGLSAVALRNAGHVGRVGDWAEMAAEAALVSVHFVNAAGSLLVAPFGGVERIFSTAPYCVGIPRPDAPPLILDFATSVVAEGKVLVASRGGKQLPANALIGPDGKESADPHLLYGDYDEGDDRKPGAGLGAIRAFGDYKGSGLAFVCELLGGALTGTGATLEGRRFANGMLSLYIDPKRLDADRMFSGEVARYARFVKTSKPATPGGEILLPGEPELKSKSERLANGIPLTDETWASIVATARSLGIDDRRIQAAVRPD